MSSERRYRTIVADPPWDIGAFGRFAGYEGPRRPEDRSGLGSTEMPYASLGVEEIAALPIDRLAAADAHLYLWTTSRFIEDAYRVARAWGFKPSTMLVWAKAPRGLGPGGAFALTAEFILFCTRGSLQPQQRVDTSWWSWKRHYVDGYPAHSAKPDGFLDLVEQVSPGPYVELFARRARFGWDYAGDGSLGTVELAGLRNPGEAA